MFGGSASHAKLVADLVVHADGTLAPLTPDQAHAFLAARNFDLIDAIELHHQHMRVYALHNILPLNPNDALLQHELLAGKVVAPGARDREGGTLLVFRAAQHAAWAREPHAIVPAVAYLASLLTDSDHVRQHGITFVVDFTDISLFNMDYTLTVALVDLLRSAHPSKLRRVFLFNMPYVWYGLLTVLQPVLSLGLNDQVQAVNTLLPQFHDEQLPVFLGGKQPFTPETHRALVAEMVSERRKKIASAAAAGAATAPLADDPPPVPPRASVSVASTTAAAPVDTTSSTLIVDAQSLPPAPVTASVAGRPRMPTPTKLAASSSDDDEDDDELPPPPPPRSNAPPKPAHGIAADQLASHFEYLQLANLIQPNFSRLQDLTPTFPNDVSLLPHNRPKNRYSNVMAFDHTRVVLPLLPGDADGETDYINANYVAAFDGTVQYICCQGPLPATVYDFWRMVWEAKSAVIVMATKTHEMNRVKCEEYWPEEGTAWELEDFVLACVSDERNEDYITRRFTLSRGGSDGGDGSVMDIVHYQFVGWPDFGIPSSAQPVLTMLDLVRARQAQTPRPGPVVVHCSAGIGRTGTFLAIDICLQSLRAQGSADVEGTILELRKQRAGMVQTANQYEFIYQALVEAVQGTPVASDEVDGSESECEDAEA